MDLKTMFPNLTVMWTRWSDYHVISQYGMHFLVPTPDALPQSVIFCGQFIHAILFCSLLLRLLSFDFSLRIFLAQAGQYLDAPEPGTYSTPHTVQFLAGIAAHRFVGMICNSSTKPMNL